MLAAIVLWVWTLDRVEASWAVLIDDTGHQMDVALARLPPEIRPGDRLLTLDGPVVRPDRAAMAARIARLAGLESPAPLGDGGVMSERRQDHFTRAAKKAGYRARSVFKLEEIDRRARLFQGGQRVLDLGSSPGSWSQYAAKKVGRRGQIVAIDLKSVEPIGANVKLIRGDAFETPAADLQGDGSPFDVVMSDMAPDTSGNGFTDHMRSIELCRRALTVAQSVLKPGGHFVCKVFEGEEVNRLVSDLNQAFDLVKRIKPKGTRSESVELFLVALRMQAPTVEAAQ